MKNKIKFVDLHHQYLDDKKSFDLAIKKTIKNTDFINGKSVREFEYNFKKKLNVKYCVSLNNGTDSLYVAMKALGLKRGQEVITTSHSWISSSSMISLAGGKAVFCDTDRKTFNISVSDIEKKINKKTAGIIAVHLFGQPCDIDKIVSICKKKNIWLIEDCAQSHFSKFKKQYTGTFGSFGSFSFYPGKNLGAYGDAGALVTDNFKLYKKAYKISKHGGFKKNQHLIEGINSRMDGIQAAILNVKLKKIDKYNSLRKEKAKIYRKLLLGVGDIVLPKIAKDRDHVFHLFVIRSKKRNNLKKYLASKGIPTAIHYPKCLPLLPAYKNFKITPDKIKNSYLNQKEILSLPIYPEIEKKKIEFICKEIKKFFLQI